MSLYAARIVSGTVNIFGLEANFAWIRFLLWLTYGRDGSPVIFVGGNPTVNCEMKSEVSEFVNAANRVLLAFWKLRVTRLFRKIILAFPELIIAS